MNARGVVVVGDHRFTDEAAALSHAQGWPLLAEPAANASRAINHLPHAPLFLTPEFIAANTPDVVVTFGRFGLSRPIVRLIRSAGEHIAVSRGASFDPLVGAQRVEHAPEFDQPAQPQWMTTWRSASDAAGSVVKAWEGFNSLAVIRDINERFTDDDAVLVAASRTVRDAEMMWKSCSAQVFMNRGANGIDGLVSTAWGIAVGSGRRTFAVMGDLAFLHDINGLLDTSTDVARPDLTYLVLDNDGGGIFSSLEQGAPQFEAHFETVFGTPHKRDLVEIARAHGVHAMRVASSTDLAKALAQPDEGVRVIVIELSSRADEQAALERLIAACAQAVKETL
jgi:2-succinyl-5-enolpyruvyl-6-hydroxy-3-cyclohexene-1-carboxylate synthase